MLLNLFQGAAADRFEFAPLSIFHFDDNSEFLLIDPDGNIAVAVAGFPVGFENPAFPVSEDAKKDAVVEIFLRGLPGKGVSDADGLAKISSEELFCLGGVPRSRASQNSFSCSPSLLTCSLNIDKICSVKILRISILGIARRSRELPRFSRWVR